MNSKRLTITHYHIAFFLSLILFFGVSSCTEQKTVTISNADENSYAELKIKNTNGNDIFFQSDDNSGAIGYKTDNEIVWVKGEPDISPIDEKTTIYEWKNNSPLVMMRAEEKGKDVTITLRVQSEMVSPSAWVINTKAATKEYFTGIFERVVDGSQNESWKKGITTALNLRGEHVDVKLKPTVSAYAPFYISSENYGIYVHGTWPGEIDFCKEKETTVQMTFEGPELIFTVIMDQSPAEIVKRHALATGPSFVPPKWTFGPWRWRDVHDNNPAYFDGSKVKAPYNSDVVEDVLMMEAYDIPCTAYWIDRPWGPGERGFDDYDVDYERLPGFENMITWLNSKNMELMLWIGPFVMGDMAETAVEKNYQLRSKNHISKHQILMDFSNQEACKWWGEKGPGKLAKMGVKGFKLDRADGEKLLDSLNLTTASGVSYRENFNDFPRQYVKATYDAVKPVLGDDFVLFPRAQYSGSAKYGAMWAGDTGNPAEGLRSALIGMLRCSVMGYPVWGSDTGGYPKRIEREPTMRWLGFSCFSPIMEVGPTNNKGFWGMNYDPSYDHELLAVWRFYSKLRMSLIDYIHHYAKVASETGMPIARPLFLEYSDQPESWNDWTTYKLGDDLLVSVVWEEGKNNQKVYLPAGETWINLWTNEEYKGGDYVMVEAMKHQIPVFLKKGSQLRLPDFTGLYNESVKRTAVEYKMSDLEAAANWN